ncbi:MAG: anaerobic benzoate catabolism transcriptional regulator [Planctomycetes bacterium ADurb.Bin126]|nr:MAG: anaerobic benzoate catabolism transcriptional regulator [Planctomycetes bacterium ADurb.Bin126]HOD84373.1 ImmA/IrrE family metallo-endopeptidase [Phycisphaerae bacterium]HQL76045.1 ImmA/IrrE family metallo-endopeptidase [Phycisphaerae bacterium]
MTATDHIAGNLRRIRTSKGLSQDEVAQGADLSRNAYRDIETGATGNPRVGNLQAIARALGVGLVELLAAPPSLTTVRFRSLKMKGIRQEARRGQIVLDVARWLKDFSLLEDLLGQKKEFRLDRVSVSLPGGRRRAVAAAERTREVLGISSDEPVRDICGLLESAGVKVRADVFDLEGFFGFSVGPADGGPAVIVNVRSDISVERRIFTSAHELGHLLLHPDAYDVKKVAEDPEQEKEADCFASHFLMPDRPFRKEWENTRGLRLVHRVLHVKRIFRVSYMTVIYRLIEMQLVDPDKVWMFFKAEYRWRYGQALTKKVEPLPLADVDFLEDRLSRLVRMGVESEKLSLSRAAEILNLSLDEMREHTLSWERAA